MRTALLVLGTVVLLAGGFAVYWMVQSGDGRRADGGAAQQQAAEPLAEGESTYTVRGGEDVWVKEFDDNRRLTNQFRAAEFSPQKEGFVRVRKPEAHFFLRGGQWIRVTGATGDVVVAGMPQQGSDPFAAGSGRAGMPSRGRLDDVHIQFYETPDAPQPMLDMTMPNAAFDNESFRIYTEGYTDTDGRQVPPDQVKVTVRGKYEFDGRGLTIRWNDRDRRLELLEIAHGERLVIKEPGALGKEPPGLGNGPKPEPAALRLSADPATALASADPAAGAAVAAGIRAAAAGPTTRRDATLYSIWFYDNVQVVQADQTLATGNVIEVFYAMRESPEKPSPTTTPAALQAEQQASAAADAGAPPRATADAATGAATASTTRSGDNAAGAATQPAQAKQEPIVVYWTGKLRIVPSETEPPAALAPGDAALQLRGAPALVTRDNVQVRCPAVTYRTADGRALLQASEAFPQVEVAQFATPADRDAADRIVKPELTLLSEWVEYAPEEGVATLGGKSKAVFPADAAGQSTETAEATWTREAVARFTGAGNETVIQSLALAGDVDVRHPQVLLKSQRLNLAFDPPAPAPAKARAAAANKKGEPARKSQPVVRQVVAEEAVHCVLLDEGGAPRELRGQHLTIHTAPDKAGKLYPTQVFARGDVRAVQEGDELTAQELTIDLVPATATPEGAKKKKPQGAKAKETSTAVELKQLVARRNVRAVSADGEVATGETLVVTNGPDGKPEVSLVGSPASVANASGTVLTSEKILIPNADEARATGPGTLKAVVEANDAKAPRQHMDVSWTESALLNAKLPENQVQVTGQVRAVMPDEDGTVNTASADRILITLVDAPPAPATQPAAKTRPIRQPVPAGQKRKGESGALASTDVDVMKGKQVSRILLNKNALVDSKLAAADGSVLRELRIDSSMLQYNVQQRRLIVPRPGRMLVRDHRPPGLKPAAGQAPPQQEDGLASNRGATAFQWSESLDYNGSEQQARMAGDVLVAYKPDDSDAPPVRLRADEVVTTFEELAPAKGAAEPAANKPRSAMDLSAAPVQVRSVRAQGNVVVQRGGDELTAPRLTYDPVTHWIRAVGTDQTPAVYSTAGRGNGTTAREFQWNTQNWKVRVVDAAGRATAGAAGGAGR